jgi:hypothetical protein
MKDLTVGAGDVHLPNGPNEPSRVRGLSALLRVADTIQHLAPEVSRRFGQPSKLGASQLRNQFVGSPRLAERQLLRSAGPRCCRFRNGVARHEQAGSHKVISVYDCR